MVNLQSLIAQRERAEHDARALLHAATGRALTADEGTQHDALVAKVTSLSEHIARLQAPEQAAAALDQITGGKRGRYMVSRLGPGSSVGQQFIDHAAMKDWLTTTKGSRSGHWRSPSVELQAAVLTSDAASGGNLVVPDYRPGIVPSPLRRPTIAELLADGTTDSNMVTVMHETQYTNAADAVAEGGVKPESTLVFDATPEPVKKVAHWLPVTDELLDDIPALRAYLDTRLMSGVRVALDRELLIGSGVAPHFLGLLNRPGLTPALPVGTMTPADAIATQAANIQVATEDLYVPDAVVLHPLDFLFIVLDKNSTEDYISGGPFEAVLPRTLWGYAVALSTGMTRGTALIGAFKTAAQFFQRGGIRVEASNSHQDYFIKDLTAIRAEQRGALAVYRSQAFGLVTGIVAPTGLQRNGAGHPAAKK